MRQINVVLFSSGISEANGMLDYVRGKLEEPAENGGRNYRCSYWRDLFAGAHDSSRISLLPTLIKKIPTFDFAVLICEGHDTTSIYRNGVKTEEHVMRDNVLFEIGLCSMALGLERTILLTDESVRMPEDLTGNNGELAVKRIVYRADKPETYSEAGTELSSYMDAVTALDDGMLDGCIHEMDAYMQANENSFSPVVVGAAASTASGYVTNYVFRILEQMDKGIILEGSGELQIVKREDVHIHVRIPGEYTEETPARAQKKTLELQLGKVPCARMREMPFRYWTEHDELHICDYPTTLVTSYNTAKIILSLESDEKYDPEAEKRFIAKELDLFERTTRMLLTRECVETVVELHYRDRTPEERRAIEDYVADVVENRVHVERADY